MSFPHLGNAKLKFFAARNKNCQDECKPCTGISPFICVYIYINLVFITQPFFNIWKSSYKIQ